MTMIPFIKAHAYGNDFLYIEERELVEIDRPQLAREMCDRHTGIGADGLILYGGTYDDATMSLFNADGGRAEVSGNGVRGLAALLLRSAEPLRSTAIVRTEAGVKRLARTERSQSRHSFRAEMGNATHVRQTSIMAGGERLDIVTLSMGNPQCVVLGPLPDGERFRRLGPAIEHHSSFPEGTNVEFAHIEAPDCVRILIWERGCGPTFSSGTGSCAALVAAASYGGAARTAEVIAPGGAQVVEWLEDGVYLTGWAEIVCEGRWLRPSPVQQT
jgi:diaminopimelate epimerase